MLNTTLMITAENLGSFVNASDSCGLIVSTLNKLVCIDKTHTINLSVSDLAKFKGCMGSSFYASLNKEENKGFHSLLSNGKSNGNGNGKTNGKAKEIEHKAVSSIPLRFLNAWKTYAGSKMPGCDSMPLELIDNGAEKSIRENAKAWLQKALLDNESNAFIMALELIDSRELESALRFIGVESKAMRKSRIDALNAENNGVLTWLQKATERGIIWFNPNDDVNSIPSSFELTRLAAIEDALNGIDVANLRKQKAGLEKIIANLTANAKAVKEYNDDPANDVKKEFSDKDSALLSESNRELTAINSKLERLADDIAAMKSNAENYIAKIQQHKSDIDQAVEAMKSNAANAVLYAEKHKAAIEKRLEAIGKAITANKDVKAEKAIADLQAMLGKNRQDSIKILIGAGKLPANYS